MQEKIIGIIGGMGPEATVDLFQKILDKTAAAEDQDHHRVLIYNNPKIPDRTAAILGDAESPLAELVKTAKTLEKAGASFLVIPCNTAHYFAAEIQKAVNIDIINMIAETAKQIAQTGAIKKVGIMGTKAVIDTGIYDQKLADLGIEVVKPFSEQKAKLMEIIYAIKSSSATEKMEQQLTQIALSLLDRGADAVVLGCTELPLLFNQISFEQPLFIPQEILAASAVKRIEA